VHQAKGMQWPVVFVRRCRRIVSRAKVRAACGVDHFLPEASIPGYARYQDRSKMSGGFSNVCGYAFEAMAVLLLGTALRHTALQNPSQSSPSSRLRSMC